MAGYARTFRRLFTRQSFARLNTKLDLKPLTWLQEWGRSDKADLTFPPHAHKKADIIPPSAVLPAMATPISQPNPSPATAYQAAAQNTSPGVANLATTGSAAPTSAPTTGSQTLPITTNTPMQPPQNFTQKYLTISASTCTAGRLANVIAALALSLCVYYAYQSNLIATKSHQGELWKDCRDRPDLATEKICQTLANKSYSSVAKRHLHGSSAVMLGKSCVPVLKSILVFLISPIVVLTAHLTRFGMSDVSNDILSCILILNSAKLSFDVPFHLLYILVYLLCGLWTAVQEKDPRMLYAPLFFISLGIWPIVVPEVVYHYRHSRPNLNIMTQILWKCHQVGVIICTVHFCYLIFFFERLGPPNSFLWLSSIATGTLHKVVRCFDYTLLRQKRQRRRKGVDHYL